MIQEFNLFFCRDDESGNPYLAIADENGNLAQTEVEQLILEKMRGNGPVSVLEGVVTFDEEDITEISDLLDKNLPVGQTPGYQVKH